MATAPPHIWLCPTCGRRVPVRADACHCGMTRARAQEAAGAQPPPAQQAAPRPTRGASDGQAALDAMTGDVKLLLGGFVLAIVGGLGWLVFAPAPQPPAPVLGYVDAGPPPPLRAADRLEPPFALPWWK